MKTVRVLIAVYISASLLIACSLEGDNSTQKQRQQKLIKLLQEPSDAVDFDKLNLIGLPISAGFCRAEKPKVAQQDCLNFAVKAGNADEAEVRVKQAQNAISRICAVRGQCELLGEGVIVLTGVWSSPSYSGNVTPYGLSTGDVHQGREFVFYLRSGIWK